MSEVFNQQYCSINKETQERCAQWLKSSEEPFAEPTADPPKTVKRQRFENSEDFDEFIDTDSEFDSVSECGTKKRKLGVQLKAEVLKLVCEWKNCDFTCKSMDAFSKHVFYHVTELEIRLTDDDTEVYVCLWSGCGFQCDVDTEIKRHVNYHAFHAKLKSIGSNVRNRIKLPKCFREKEWTNVLDTLPPHTCEWSGCTNKPFNNYHMYLYHISSHIENNPRGNKVNGGVKCFWANCSGKFSSIYRLREHVRVHTKEKVIACPDCGTMFANNTKFHDHCKRQIPLDVQGFQCSYCNKFYATKSILREHMRNHIFHYKCSICNMSCDSPSSLQRHILYRHSTERNFQCKLCPHAAKTQQDLDSHMNCHCDNSNYVCNVEGCQYSCKNPYTLDRHVEKVHQMEVRWYCCRECPIKYRKSYRLTRHLIEVHHLQQISGHKRFQYVLEDDGCYRLQTIRYETIEEGRDKDDEDVDLDYNNEQICKGYINEEGLIINPESSETVNESNMDTSDHFKSSRLPIQNILISIEEIDEHGNVINTKVVEAQQTTELPPTSEPPIILSVLNN